MTFIQQLWLILAGIWIVLEVAVVYKTRVSVDDSFSLVNSYRSDRLIWLAVVFSIIGAFVFKQLQLAQFPISYGLRQIMALVLMSMGLMIRFCAIKSLGRFFSTTVVIQTEHLLIDHGLYHYIRHPAYTGLLLSFFATGIAMGDFLAMLVLLRPITYVLYQRISVEEALLISYFGKNYQNYAVRTKKLIPGLY